MLSSFSNYNFANPLWLLLLAVIPLYFFFRKKLRKGREFKIAVPEVDKEKLSLKNWKTYLYKAMPFLWMAGFTFLTLAMARPQERFQKQKITSDGIDIVMALDLSPSMLAKDFEPNRLTAAREVISEFIKQRPSDRIGLTLFSGESYTASPPTLDHKVLLQFLNDLEYGNLEDGTAIGMGLSTSVNRIKDSKAKSKIVILVTDGSNNSGMVDPMEAAEIATEYGIKVYTIGVGTNGEALFPFRIGRQIKYRYAPVNIDEELLIKIADETGGAYFRAQDEEELKQIYNKINQLEKSTFDSTTLVRKEDRYHGLLTLGLLFILIHFTCKSTIFRNIYTA